MSENYAPYAKYSDQQLADTHAYWMGVHRAAKNPAQRARAERGASLAATEMRRRAAVRPPLANFFNRVRP